jgi:hypothetical protein
MLFTELMEVPRGGTLLISWPTFSTAAGQSVAAGRTSVTLSSGGVLSVALVPNTGSTPAGTFYTVVYQLDDGSVKTEFWNVTTTSPTTIAAVRTILGSGNSAVTGSSGGPYVSKAGDTMTGPLQLPGDPVAPNQAATKHYVDSGLAAKADVIGGVVPSGQLGNGVANSSVCLHGDNSWEGCGTSSNAVSIQNIPVDPAAPVDNQVITYVASAGRYEPRAGSGVTAGMAATKYAPDFNWSQSPSSSLTAAGANTVTLAACVAGVLASEPQYYVYIAGTGTAEAVLVTGGTCNGDGAPGTLQFTTLNTHSAGYTIGSATGGLQEALIVARFTPTNPTGTSQSGKVIVPPGEYKAFARVSIRADNMTVDFSGSIVECWMNDTCIFVGDGLTLKFYLSQIPFGRAGLTLLDEEYAGTALNPTLWSKTDPASAVTVGNGKLQVAGGTGVDGQSTVVFGEKIELGGALILQHGDVVFNAASDGVLGGLYPNAIQSGAAWPDSASLRMPGSQPSVCW